MYSKLNISQEVREMRSELNFKVHDKGTCVVIEGPRFSTRAEVRNYSSATLGQLQAQLIYRLNPIYKVVPDWISV